MIMAPLLLVSAVLTSALVVILWLPIEVVVFARRSGNTLRRSRYLRQLMENLVVWVGLFTVGVAAVTAGGYALSLTLGGWAETICPTAIGAMVFEGAKIFDIHSLSAQLLILAPNLLWIWAIGKALSKLQQISLCREERMLDLDRDSSSSVAQRQAIARWRLMVTTATMVVFAVASGLLLFA